MQITDAVWEQRNLGVSCYEIKIEHQDTLEDVSRKYSGLAEKQYMVVKIPSSCNWAISYFQGLGYKFIEAAVNLEHNLNQIPVSPRIKKVFDKCTYSLMNESDISFLKSEIDKGIFKTDRIYLDPEFKSGRSAQRYKYWLEDLIASGQIPQKVCYNNDTVGFFLSKEIKPNIYDGILAGTYGDYEGTGLGVCIQYMGLEYAVKHKAKKYLGHVSGNNISVLKALVSLGFGITEIEYVFVKHN